MKEARFSGFGPALFAAGLLGVVLLSAAVYYRSVRAQRFWEPALAISKPRVEFAEGVQELLQKKFGTSNIPGIGVFGESIFLDSRIFAAHGHRGDQAGIRQLDELAGVLLAILEDPDLNTMFDFVLLATFFGTGEQQPAYSLEMRREQQQGTDALLRLLFSAEPRLLHRHSPVFLTASLPVRLNDSSLRLVEIRFIRAGREHISVLQDLEQYAR